MANTDIQLQPKIQIVPKIQNEQKVNLAVLAQNDFGLVCFNLSPFYVFCMVLFFTQKPIERKY
jgi:hypothetical protein